ncbi:MarR family transcriptional regulator [Micromonospora profundi]|uniref:MarR family transcriptional regulator n=1 Tax=Micromonospora profundi TaxID=1420889 RepID=UPI00364F670F
MANADAVPPSADATAIVVSDGSPPSSSTPTASWVTPHEYDTLHALAGRRGRAAPSDLAADLAVAPASITARVDTLLRRGFVRRIPSTVDRRRVDVELTDEGEAAWRGAMEVQGAEEHRLLGALSTTERRLLSDLLRRVLLVAEQPTDTQPSD